MPFGPKRTAGISGHSIAPRLGARVCGSRWKMWKTLGSGGRQGRGQKGCRRAGRGPEGQGKVRKRWEGNAMLQYLPLKAEPSRLKCCTVINKVGRSWSLVPTHTSPSEEG